MVVRAARVGGSLTCISGCAHYGIWLPPDEVLHVAVPNGSRHLKDPMTGAPIDGTNENVVVHWSGPAGPTTSFRPGALDIVTCLVEVLHCQPADLAFAVVESAVHHRVLTIDALGLLREKVPSRARLLAAIHGKSESGTEALFYFRMLGAGIRMEPQVEIEGVGRVDFLVGDRLIIEIDSETHHGTAENRRRDLGRDAVAASFDYETLRFDYVMVMYDWDFVAVAVEAVVARNGHLRHNQIASTSVADSPRRGSGARARRVVPVTDFGEVVGRKR
jgi:very-short-patch-repair endonuclease